MTTFDELERKGPGIVWTFFDNQQTMQDLAKAAEGNAPIKLTEPFNGHFFIVSIMTARRRLQGEYLDGAIVTEVAMHQVYDVQSA